MVDFAIFPMFLIRRVVFEKYGHLRDIKRKMFICIMNGPLLELKATDTVIAKKHGNMKVRFYNLNFVDQLNGVTNSLILNLLVLKS